MLPNDPSSSSSSSVHPPSSSDGYNNAKGYSSYAAQPNISVDGPTTSLAAAPSSGLMSSHSHPSSSATSAPDPSTTATTASSSAQLSNPSNVYTSGSIQGSGSLSTYPISDGFGGGLPPGVSAGQRNASYSSTTAPLTPYQGVYSPSINADMSSFMSTAHTASSSQQHQQQPQDVVPTTFDEATLRALCETDVGVPLLYERIKQSMTSCREASAFFKKRAQVEEEYGRTMQKLTKGSLDSYGSAEAKAGTYVTSWHTMLSLHETVAEGRIRLAQRLSEMSDELSNLAKEVDKNRKNAKETGGRLEKNLLDAEASVDKARARFDSSAEELERLLLLKQGESLKGAELSSSNSPFGGLGGATNKGRSLGKAMTKGGMLFKAKTPQQLVKQEDEARARTAQLSDAFRREVLQTQQMRQEYFNLQLPRILRSLKESAEEIDNGLQYHLSRYAFLFESTVLGDGMALNPVGIAAESATGLKAAAENIDNRTDFKTFMQNYQIVHARDYKGPRRQGPYEEGFVENGSTAGAGSINRAGGNEYNSGVGGSGSNGYLSNSAGGAATSQRAIFGVDLATQMIRDNVDVPGILEKCAAAVEQLGLESMGIYRLSGTTSKVQRLKAKFDADWTVVDLMEDAEALSDVNIITGCLKLWFRELPEPLLTWELYRPFIDAAKVDNDRLRHIRLHEVVNQLPDANYSTLKALMGHLDRIRSEESINQMGHSNLAIVFGPTLLGPPPRGMTFENQASNFSSSEAAGAGGASAATNGSGPGGTDDVEPNALADMAHQAKAVETILLHYKDIFLEEDEIAAEEQKKRERDEQRARGF